MQGPRSGHFRDELYFVACGKRLAWAAAVGASAVNLAQGHLLTMNVFEILLWSGTALAALLALPAALWQGRNGLPFLEPIRNGQLYRNAPLSAGQLLGGIVLEERLLGFPLAVGGRAEDSSSAGSPRNRTSRSMCCAARPARSKWPSRRRRASCSGR